MVRRQDRVALAAFAAAAVCAGGNAVGIRFSNRELAPLWGAGLRFALAAVILLAVVFALRLELPRGRALAGAALYGLLTVGVSFSLLYYALLQLHAGFVQTLLALVPLVTLLLAVAQRQERLRMIALVGALLAAAGIVVMTHAPLGGPVPPMAVLATLGSVACAAQGGVLVRSFPPVHPIVLNTVGMTAGAALLLVESLLFGESFAIPRRAETWLALAFLVVIDSIIVSVLYLVVLRYWNASRASYLFVLIPFVTTVFSSWLDKESLNALTVAGGLLVLAGVYVGTLRRPTAAPDGVPAPRGRGLADDPGRSDAVDRKR